MPKIICEARELPFDENNNCISCGHHEAEPLWYCPKCGEFIPNLPQIEEYPCDGGHVWSLNLFGVGVVCETCGLKSKYEHDDNGRYCHQCCGYVCFCGDDDDDVDNMSL